MPLDQPHQQPPPSRDDSLWEQLLAPHGWWLKVLVEHIEELRHRMLLALLGPAFASLVTLYYGKELVAWLLRPGLSVLVALGLPPYFLALGATTGFTVYIKVSLVAGVVLTSPWIAYQLWKLVSPRMPRTGRKIVAVIAPFSGLMSVLAVAFLYYLLLPVSLAFLLLFSATMPAPNLTPPSKHSLLGRLTGLTIRSSGLDLSNTRAFNVPPNAGGAKPAEPAPLPILKEDPDHPPDNSYWFSAAQGELHAAVGGRIVRFGPVGGGPILRPNLDLNQYISFVTMMGLGILIAFQVPVVMLILGWAQVVDPRWLSKYRKYCIFMCFVLGAVFTPTPDPFNMMVLTLPLWVLFELGMGLMWLTYRRRGARGPGGQGAQ